MQLVKKISVQPFLLPFSDYVIEIPVVIYILLVIGVMLGSANAVNFTDGVDVFGSPERWLLHQGFMPLLLLV